MRAGEGFLSQSSKWLHFGLGRATQIEKVIVHWPGTGSEEFSFLGFEVDRRYRLVQGSGEPRREESADRNTRLKPSTPELPPTPDIARIPLVDLITVPSFDYEGFDGRKHPLPIATGSPLLVNLWASWCRPCLAELSEITARQDEIREAGIQVITLAIDGVGEDSSDPAAAERFLLSSNFPFTFGRATPELLWTFQYLHNRMIPMQRRLPLPTSLLIDGQGRLTVIYKGPVAIDDVLADVASAQGSRLERLAHSASFAGRTIADPHIELLAKNWAIKIRYLLAASLQKKGYLDLAITQYSELLQLAPDFADAHNQLGIIFWNAGRRDSALGHFQKAVRVGETYPEAHNWVGAALAMRGQFTEAAQHLEQALRIRPDYAEAHNNIANIYKNQDNRSGALEHYHRALALNPNYADAHFNLGRFLLARGDLSEAKDHLNKTIELQPQNAEAHNNLGVVFAKQGKLKEAGKHFVEALRRKPDHREAQENLARLRRLNGQ